MPDLHRPREVVGQALHPILDAVARGEQQDRDIAPRAQPSADLQSVQAGHQDVQDHHVGRPAPRQFQPIGATMGYIDAVALINQATPQRVRDLAVVVDHQDMRCRPHGTRLITVVHLSPSLSAASRRTC